MRVFMLGALIVVGACHASTESDLDGVCTIFCRCETVLPAGQQQCIADCERGNVTNPPSGDAGVIVDITLPEGCADCIYEHEASCASLKASCNGACSQPNF